MWLLTTNLWRRAFPDYSSLRSSSSEDVTSSSLDKFDIEKSSNIHQVRTQILYYILAVTLVLGSFVVAGTLVHSASSAANRVSTCQQPVTRREWRSLSHNEKDAYIAAVVCLSSQPSILHANTTALDDFAWLHAHVGNYSHGSAAFLAWHRLFLHTFEITLHQQCGYKKQIPYWDWSLDWENIFASPVWAIEQGFGGDGNSSLEPTLNYGRCVTNGPFATLQVSFAGESAKKHCLSRGFQDQNVHNYSGYNVRPEALEQLLQTEDYETFYHAVESGPHDTIPNMVRGDFYLLTAPNDPVFYLHHAALDRLWWRWQQKRPRIRTQEISGPASNSTTMEATLKDILPMPGYAGLVHIGDIMDAQAGFLCYQY